jgi:hypothetical protein
MAGDVPQGEDDQAACPAADRGGAGGFLEARRAADLLAFTHRSRATGAGGGGPQRRASGPT